MLLKRSLLLILLLGTSSLAEALDFNSAFDKIVDNDRDLRAQKMEVETYGGLAFSKKLFWTPSLTVGRASPVNESKLEGDSRDFASLNWNLFRFGSDFYAAKAAHATYRSKQSSLNNQQLLTETAAAKILFERLSVNENRKLAENLEKAQADLLQVARLRFDRGLLAKEELDKSEIDFENAKTRLRNIEITQNSSQASLITRAGEDLTDFRWPWMSFLNKSFKQPRIDKGQSFTALSMNHLKMAADAERNSKALAFLPQVDLAVEKTIAPSEDTNEWQGSLLFTWKLYDRFSDWSAIRTARAQAHYYDWAYEQSLRDEPVQIETTWKKLLTSQAEAHSRLKVRNRSQHLFDASLRKFKMGRITVNEVVVDQSRHLDSEQLLVQSLQDFHLSLLAWCHSQNLSLRECLK